MKTRMGLSLLITMQIKKNTKAPLTNVVLGKLTKQTRSKEAEERPELEIMAKTRRSRNKNLFLASQKDHRRLFIRVFSGGRWSSDVICLWHRGRSFDFYVCP